MKKKKRLNKQINLFGLKFDYKDYTKRMVPDADFEFKKVYKKMGINWSNKTAIKTKTKFWDCKKNYPTDISEFINKFFKKRKPKDIEGIWQQNVYGGVFVYGLVKEKDYFHAYHIENSVKIMQTSGSFFKDIFNPPEADYTILSGTKFGAFYYEKKKKILHEADKKYMKFKGIATVINTMSGEDPYPINYEIDYNVARVNDRHLMGLADYQIKMEEKYGVSKDSIKIWPNAIVKKISKNHPGFKNYDDRKKDIDDEKKSGGSVGSGFFVTNKGHIVTNYHVIKDGKKNIKFLFNDEEISAKVIASDQRLDLALLKAKIENKNFIKFTNKSPQKAQNILVAGFPYGKAISDDLKVTAGIINSLKGIGNNTSMLQIDATINPGNSGGPIVDKETGNLVAVATMKLNKDFTKAAFGIESENTNYGIKSSQVKDFLEANNLKATVKKNKFKINELEQSTVFIYCK